MRSAALAYNLANINSPQFQPLEVNFEATLRKAAGLGEAAVQGTQFEFKAGRMFAPGEERREDLIVVDASNNAMRYAALADMIGRRFAIGAAAGGGR
jgi:hypothetical protein